MTTETDLDDPQIETYSSKIWVVLRKQSIYKKGKFDYSHIGSGQRIRENAATEFFFVIVQIE